MSAMLATILDFFGMSLQNFVHMDRGFRKVFRDSNRLEHFKFMTLFHVVTVIFRGNTIKDYVTLKMHF